MIRRSGRAVSATFDTRAEAEHWATQAEASIIRDPRAAVAAVLSPDHAAAGLFRRYAEAVSPAKKGARWELLRLAALARDPLFARPLAGFGGPDMGEWRDRRLCEVAPNTVNRELNLISAVFTHAMKEWRIGLAVNPVHQVMRPRNPAPRTRRVADKERAAICLALGWDGKSAPAGPGTYAAWAFCFALETAMRKGEILGLSWPDVDRAGRYVRLRDTKNGDARDVPLSSRALALLDLLSPGSGRLVPLSSGVLDMTFRRAKIAAGLADLRFHDARREAATTMSKKLANVLELAAVANTASC